MKKNGDDQWTVKQRFINNRNIISKSITTLIFALFMFYGKVQQLQDVPAVHSYYVVRHSFDSGLLFLIALLGIFGLYVSFSKYHMEKGKAMFIVIGSGLWFAYTGLFLYRDFLFPHPPSLQTALISAIAISFVLDAKAGDF